MQSNIVLYGGFVKNRKTGKYDKFFETEISPLIAKDRAILTARVANERKDCSYDLEDVLVMKSRVLTLSSEWEPLQGSEQAMVSRARAVSTPPCFLEEHDNPYPLCVGRGMKACAHCCLWVDYDLGEDEVRVIRPLDKQFYLVEIEESYCRTIIVYAESDTKAEEIANQLCDSGVVDMHRNCYAGRACNSAGPASKDDLKIYSVYESMEDSV